jgi:hypothetical protein
VKRQRARPAVAPLSLAHLDELEALARPAPGVWSMSDAMAHHAACRAAIAQLVEALRPRLTAERAAADAAAAELAHRLEELGVSRY